MKIKWTEPSARDLENIYEYIKKDSEYYAAIFIEKIIKAPEVLVSILTVIHSSRDLEQIDLKEKT